MLKTGCPRQGLDSVLYVTLSSSNIMVFLKAKICWHFLLNWLAGEIKQTTCTVLYDGTKEKAYEKKKKDQVEITKVHIKIKN